MELIRGLGNCRPEHHGCVATIGNFDGVHLGHQSIFAQVTEAAREQAMPSCVITFEPLPHDYFGSRSSEPGPARLQSLRDKVACIEKCGIDRMLILHFNQAQAEQPAASFIEQILVRAIGTAHLVIGDDFRFGHQRSGDFDMLVRAGKQHGFSVVGTDTVTAIGASDRVSSTAVRQALSDGNCAMASTLLGRPYTVTGRVVKGEQVGRQLGYPTANVALKTLRPPCRGVFAVTAVTSAGERLPGVANLGERPTVGGRKLLLEAHLFDRSDDLYGQLLSVEFEHFIRAEKKFDSLDDLKAAITADEQQARKHFGLS